MNGKIDAEKILLKKLFSNEFWFIIPSYQRPYVWGTDNINDLLDDLFYAYETKASNEYFLGALVLQRKENEIDFEVLDGQQRLTTFCMLIATLRDLIEKDKIKKALQKMLYEEENPLENLMAKSKLTTEIRSDVENFINKYIIEENGTLNLKELEEKTKDKNISISNMAKALITFNDILKERNDLDKFATYLNMKAMFIYVSTDNTEDAFRLFTILNNRGVPLTTADILKSSNLGEIHDKKKEEYARKWEELEQNFGDKFDRFLNFIRTIILKEKARANLLDEFIEKIYKKDKLKKGLETVDLLDRYDMHYEKIINLNDNSIDASVDKKSLNEYRNLLTILKIGFNSEDWIPPLLLYFDKFGYEKLNEFLILLDKKFAGDWICRKTPTMRLEAMNNILKVIESSKNSSEVLNDSNIFSFDKEYFINQISGNVYGERYTKYLLLKLEYLQRENSTVYLQGYNNISVEHVLPQNPNPDSEWRRLFTEEESLELTHKLGNLVVISKRKNSKLGNSDYKYKKEKYLNDRLEIFQSAKIFLDEADTWDKETIIKRQEKLISLLEGSVS